MTAGALRSAVAWTGVTSARESNERAPSGFTAAMAGVDERMGERWIGEWRSKAAQARA